MLMVKDDDADKFADACGEVSTLCHVKADTLTAIGNKFSAKIMSDISMKGCQLTLWVYKRMTANLMGL